MYLVSPRLPSAPHHIEMRSLCYSRFCRAVCACPSQTPYLFPPFFPLATVSSFSTSVSLFLNLNFILEYSWFRRRQWHPTPVLLPGKSHGQRSLVGCSPWGLEESDMTDRLHFHFSLSCIGEGNGNPLRCSCLENPRDWGAWWAAVYGVAQSRTRLKRRSSSSSSSSTADL